MKALLMISLTLLLLAACANELAGNSRSVIVRAGAAMAGKAQQAADAHCGKFDRVAVLSGKNSPIEWVYECVSK